MFRLITPKSKGDLGVNQVVSRTFKNYLQNLRAKKTFVEGNEFDWFKEGFPDERSDFLMEVTTLGGAKGSEN